MIQDGFPLMGILVATLAVVLAAIEIGYRTGLALSFSLVLLLIADLDRPHRRHGPSRPVGDE